MLSEFLLPPADKVPTAPASCRADDGAEPPLQVRKAELRLQIVKKARHLAIARSPGAPDFKRVWIETGETFGPKNADALIIAWLP